MQSFGAFFNDNKTLAIALLIIAGIFSFAVLIFLYRLLFGRRLHMAGSSRTRQPRLGVVDAFDLDRQRQLVLVRRDNVEHLIMIGGPNDLVIESAFVRMQPAVIGPMGRDKEVGAGPTAPMAPMPAALAPAVAPGPAIDASAQGISAAPVVAANGRDRAVPPLELGEPLSLGEPLDLIPAPAPVTGAAAPAPPEPLPPLSAPDPEPVPPPAANPEPPPPRPIPNRFSTGLTPRPTSSIPRPSSLPPRPPGQASTLPPRIPTLGPRPMPSAPLSRGTSAASLRRDPPPPPITPAPAVGPVSTDIEAHVAKPAESAAPAPPTVPADQMRPSAEPFNAASPERPAAGSLPTTLDTLESLEEEMARLLGRPPTTPEKH